MNFTYATSGRPEARGRYPCVIYVCAPRGRGRARCVISFSVDMIELRGGFWLVSALLCILLYILPVAVVSRDIPVNGMCVCEV